MIPSAAAQHRSKHFDQLLARELAYIERGHTQNLLTYDKFERLIDRDRKRILNLKRKKLILSPIDDHWSRQSELSGASIVSSTVVNSQTVTEEESSTIIPRFRRQCYKAHRLPPIVKATRSTSSIKDLHWKAVQQIQTANRENEASTVVNAEPPKKFRLALSPVEEHLQSFKETLPIYQGIHKGFDNFAPAALYSNRTLVAMR